MKKIKMFIKVEGGYPLNNFINAINLNRQLTKRDLLLLPIIMIMIFLLFNNLGTLKGVKDKENIKVNGVTGNRNLKVSKTSITEVESKKTSNKKDKFSVRTIPNNNGSNEVIGIEKTPINNIKNTVTDLATKVDNTIENGNLPLEEGEEDEEALGNTFKNLTSDASKKKILEFASKDIIHLKRDIFYSDRVNESPSIPKGDPRDQGVISTEGKLKTKVVGISIGTKKTFITENGLILGVGDEIPEGLVVSIAKDSINIKNIDGSIEKLYLNKF